MTTTSLTRVRSLLEPAELREQTTDRQGFLDVLGASVPSPMPTLAQRAMNSRVFAALYERMFRPVVFYLASGITTTTEFDRAAQAMHLPQSRLVLDVACGPGNFTRLLGDSIDDNSIAVGLDISAPMLERAVRKTRGHRVAYVRGDARHLPFAAETFDAACCFAALDLAPDPLRIVTDMIRVLRPGGRICIQTTYTGNNAVLRRATQAIAPSGVRMFERWTFTQLLADGGLADIDQDLHRVTQYITAAKQ